MRISFHKQYCKAFDKLSLKQQEKVVEAIDLFQQNYSTPQLHNHALKGKLKGYRAISTGGDLRLIFREIDNYRIVEFVMVGSHNQVY